MKVAFLTAHLSEAAGGFAYAIPGIVAGLERCPGIDPHIVGIRDDLSPEAWRCWGANVHAHRQVGLRAFGWAPSLPSALRRLAPDLVDAQGLWMYPSRASLQWYHHAGRPYVLTPHGMLHPWSLGRSSWKKHVVSRWFEDEHLGRAACLRATAPDEARHFRAYGLRNAIALVPNGVEVPACTEQRRERDRRRVLFLGRIHPVKGIDFLLRAWARANARHQDWELVIAGPDETRHRTDLQQFARDLALSGIEWRDAVYGNEKSAIYRSADLLVLPTHTENFGLVVAEALAHQVPVITTRNAPWDGLEQHRCGWWIDLSDEALATTLDEAMSMPDAERRVMGLRGRAWMARDFAWPAIARQMHEVYTWVLGGGPPPSCVMTD